MISQKRKDIFWYPCPHPALECVEGSFMELKHTARSVKSGARTDWQNRSEPTTDTAMAEKQCRSGWPGGQLCRPNPSSMPALKGIPRWRPATWLETRWWQDSRTSQLEFWLNDSEDWRMVFEVRPMEDWRPGSGQADGRLKTRIQSGQAADWGAGICHTTDGEPEAGVCQTADRETRSLERRRPSQEQMRCQPTQEDALDQMSRQLTQEKAQD